MHNLVNALVGFIFGLGLLISGMADPAKVLNFLDLAGTFDPSLIFVMLGAVVVTFAGYRLVLRRPRPLLAERFFLPTLKEIDARVILGPAIFGIGWGAVGVLPGSRHHLARVAGDARRHWSRAPARATAGARQGDDPCWIQRRLKRPLRSKLAMAIDTVFPALILLMSIR
jgi:hypothetical protein